MVPNGFPALVHYPACANIRREGPYSVGEGVGHHDLVITKDHKKNIAELSTNQATDVLRIVQKRCLMLARDRCLLYTSMFFNWGTTAGASVPHPHYQVLTMPIIPPDVHHSLLGSERYFKKHRRCVHCDMLAYERKFKKRIVAENPRAIAVAPFASREPFEVKLFPKKHFPFFERTPFGDLKGTTLILQAVLKKMKRRLNDPDLNFYLHTGPLKNQDTYRHYHWHIEIVPRVTVLAGFELGTGIEINVVDPEAAASILKK